MTAIIELMDGTQTTHEKHRISAVYILEHTATGMMYIGRTYGLHQRLIGFKTCFNTGDGNRDLLELYRQDPHFTVAYIETEYNCDQTAIIIKLTEKLLPYGRLIKPYKATKSPYQIWREAEAKRKKIIRQKHKGEWSSDKLLRPKTPSGFVSTIDNPLPDRNEEW